MKLNNAMAKPVLASAAAMGILFTAGIASAQEAARPCPHDHHYGDGASACEVRTYTMAAPAELRVNASPNGGIMLTGEQRADVKVEAEVAAWGKTDAEARDLLAHITVSASGDTVSATGPGHDDRHWNVSYKISAPQNISSNLQAENGGLRVSNINGQEQLETENGSIVIENAGGDVKGHTTNGSIRADLSGARWDGAGLDLTTVNGSVKVAVPAGFAAHLTASTVNGSLKVDMPITMTGTIKNRIETDLNGGGPPVHLETTNGSVRVEQQ